MSPGEAERIAALRRFETADASLGAGLDRIAALAADLFDAPVGLVSLIGETRILHKGRFGPSAAIVARDAFIWAGATDPAEPDAVLIADTLADTRYRDHPAVVGEPRLRFCAAAALVTPDGWRIGTVSAIDSQPRLSPGRRDIERLKVLAAIVMDELELRRAHRALLDSERLLRLAESMAAVGHWRYDAATARMTWSDEVYRIHGMAREAGPPPFSDVLDLYPLEDQRKVGSQLADTITARSGFQVELRLRRPDGESRRVVAKALCELDEAGSLTGLFGVIQDVTDQAATLAALRDSEARYRLLAEQATDIIVSIGLDGRIGFVSPAVEAIGGWQPGDLLGTPALDIVHREDRAALRCHFIGMRRRGPARTPKAVEFRAHHADGRWIWLEANPTLVIDPNGGEPVGWVDIVRDIAVRKAHDIELAAARRAAEDSARAKADFLANMSHEIRTPLNSIIGFTQVLKRDATLGESQLSQVNRVEEAGRSLLSVVNDVLELSKLEAGAVIVERRRFSPARLARDTAALIRPQAADKGLPLIVEITPDATTPVIGDPDRLRQILLNLLSNAVKFTVAGEVRLRLKAETVGAQLQLHIAVEDSGIGIAAEQIPNLFQRYAQADGTISRRFGGTGLGLAISKRLAEAMNGSIAVDSTLMVGSRFVVSLALPVAEAPGLPLPEPAADAPPDPSRLSAMRGARLLVVEDVPINRKLVQAMLSPLGCVVDAVANGAEAVAAVQARDYALVLMDMEMPVMDGLEATRAIRRLGGRFATLPIVALTANVFSEQTDRARAAGMDDLITKPIESDHLTETVVRWSTDRSRQAAMQA